MAVLGPGSLTAYWRFQRGVAKAQLAAWLPPGRRLLIDISGASANCATQAAARGHTVVRVVPGARAEGTAAHTTLSAVPAGKDAGRETGRAPHRTQRRPGVPARAGSSPRMAPCRGS